MSCCQAERGILSCAASECDGDTCKPAKTKVASSTVNGTPFPSTPSPAPLEPSPQDGVQQSGCEVQDCCQSPCGDSAASMSNGCEDDCCDQDGDGNAGSRCDAPADRDRGCDGNVCCRSESPASGEGCCGNGLVKEQRDGCCGNGPVKGQKDGYGGNGSMKEQEDGCCGTGPMKEREGACCLKETVANGGCGKSSETALRPNAKEDSCCSPRSRERASSGGTGQATSSCAQGFSVTVEQEPMCPCCVQSMLKTNLRVLNILMSRVTEAQNQFKRCCIAFADLCCAKSRTESGCCETVCSDDESCSVPHLLKDDYRPVSSMQDLEKTDKEQIQQGISTPGPGGKEDVLLEVIGMDCPDCLSKVTGAVKMLAGAEVINADGVRGLVRVQYEPARIDLKAIQTFAARASGFTINLLDTADAESEKTLILPLALRTMPPDHLLQRYQAKIVGSPGKSSWHILSYRVEDGRQPRSGCHLDLSIALGSLTEPKIRDVMQSLASYGATLRPHREDRNHRRINRDIRNISLRTLASLALTIPILVLVWSPTALLPDHTSQSIQLGLATLIVIVAWPVYSGSFRSAYYLHRADLGVLTSFSTLTSYIFSVIAFAFELAGRDVGEPFFETVGLLITLIFAGRMLQASTRKLGLRAVGNLGRLQPDMARLVSSSSEREESIDVRLLHYNDTIRIKQGEIVPTDGVVLRGHAAIDESSLTGESVAVPKARGSTVTAGTTLMTGSVDLIVTRLVPENAISAIMDAVSASSTGSEYQDLADRMAGWLLPIAGVCCLAAFIGWMLVERLRRDLEWGEAVISAVGYAIAIAAVSCPCALAIAVTLVTSISMATTVNEGVLFRSIQALLTAHSVRAFAFDKTGTLSQGVMAVQQTFYDDDPLSLRLIHAITAASNHPVSETAKRYLETLHANVDFSSQSQSVESFGDVKVIPGQGVSATFFGFPVRAGNATFTQTESHSLVREYLDRGMTILVITLGQQLIGLFGMKDQPRPGVENLIRNLARARKSVSLVSGDNHSAVHAFARGVGIEPDLVHAGQNPTSKATVVQALKDSLPPGGKVAFVGDGINDTIALSTADVSIATGSASNASSDIILLSSDVPRAIESIIATSRLTRNHVIVSLAFCAVYFTVAILLASGVTGWRIPPAYAGLGELVSILPVLLVGGSLASLKAIQRNRA